MSRDSKQFLKLAVRLDKLLEKQIDMFLADRPFLDNPGIKLEIKEEHTDEEIEEKIAIAFEIEEITKKIKELS